MLVRVDGTFYVRKSRCVWVDYLTCIYLPNLSDPATLGCVESLLIEANPDTAIVIAYHPDATGWCVEVGDRHFYGADRGEALVAALEAA